MRSRAAILHEYGQPWSVEEFSLDPPRAGEVLIQLVASGLCHSDEHIRMGYLVPPDAPRRLGAPTIGGHEGSGVVVEVGEGVSHLAPGDHVVTSFVAVCGQCRWCASGMEYLCDSGAGTLKPGMPTDGTFRHHTRDGRDLGHTSKIGAFAEHTVVSADSLVKIDRHLPLVPAAHPIRVLQPEERHSEAGGTVRGRTPALRRDGDQALPARRDQRSLRGPGCG